jgi:hypothetical protein
MTGRTWTAKMKGHDIKVTSEKLAQWRDFYLSDPELVSRISELMWFDMYVLEAEFGVSPHDIIKSVLDLEAGEKSQGVKPATPFGKLPLKGLWHKHFFSAHFLVNNIILGHGKNGLAKLIDEVFDAANSPIVTHEMIAELARRATRDPVEQRDTAGKLTGEWIIFTKQGGKNYYISANTHAAGDQFIYDRITQYCVRDFPQLTDWLKALQSP